jgi:hypothetical protein
MGSVQFEKALSFFFTFPPFTTKTIHKILLTPFYSNRHADKKVKRPKNTERENLACFRLLLTACWVAVFSVTISFLSLFSLSLCDETIVFVKTETEMYLGSLNAFRLSGQSIKNASPNTNFLYFSFHRFLS